jgi:hypothetical protein
MKSSEILNAPSAEDRTPSENRFELWLRQRRGNGLLLLLGVVFLLFGLDSILAYAVVLSGVRQADAFYATAWMSTRAADHANLPGLREVLLRHPKRYPSYSDRFEADGLHGGRLVRNFLTTTADLNLKTDWIRNLSASARKRTGSRNLSGSARTIRDSRRWPRGCCITTSRSP